MEMKEIPGATLRSEPFDFGNVAQLVFNLFGNQRLNSLSVGARQERGQRHRALR